jgi:hypothetical protein
MRKYSRILLLVLSLFLFLSLMAQKKPKEDPNWDQWNFRIGPYFWFISMDGELIRPPEPPSIFQPIYTPPKISIDASFKEIKSSIKFAGMLTGVYRNKLLITQFHFTGIILESKAITPNEFLLQNSIIRWTYFSGDFEAGYRMLKKKKLEVDILGGLKLAYIKIGVATDILGIKSISGEREHLILDPVIAANFIYRPWKRWELLLYCDWGPDFLSKDITYQYMSGVNFLISKNVFVSLGYRDHFLELPYENASYNGRLKGVFLRFGAQF